MKIFVSWSGNLSKEVATAIRDWLPYVINNVQIFLSSEDISIGSRWWLEISQALEESNFGVLCLTKENVNKPWILFEAGALAKALGQSLVCPILIDITKPSDVVGPLSQFQSFQPTEQDFYKFVALINNSLEDSALDPERLKNSFSKWWPDLKQRIDEAREISNKQSTIQDTVNQAPNRDTREVLEEVLQLCRNMNQTLIRDVNITLQNSDEETKALFLNALTKIKLSKNRPLPTNVSIISDTMKKIDQTFNIEKTSFGSFNRIVKHYEDKGLITTERSSNGGILLREIHL